MKRLLIISALLTSFIAFPQSKSIPVKPCNPDLLEAWIPANIKIQGYLGEKIDLCINQRIKKQDVPHLIESFGHRNETHLWQTEFWGKWILSAIAAYEYKHDPELLEMIQEAVSELLTTQTPDGYIGNYSPEAQLKQWDIWGRKYTLLGLLFLRYFGRSESAGSRTEAGRSLAHPGWAW